MAISEVERRTHHDGRSVHLFVVRERDRIREQAANEQIEAFYSGEYSAHFASPKSPAQTDIFVAPPPIEFQNRGRNGDRAKKNGVIINLLLENPQDFPVSEVSKGFIERHFPRILKFATTLRNKGRLNPNMGKILSR